jgi:hypothetical protein
MYENDWHVFLRPDSLLALHNDERCLSLFSSLKKMKNDIDR